MRRSWSSGCAAPTGLRRVRRSASRRAAGNTILGERYRTLWGADTLEDELCGLTFPARRAVVLSGEPRSGGGALPQGRRVRGADRRGAGRRSLLRRGDDHAGHGRRRRTRHRGGDRPGGNRGRAPRMRARNGIENVEFFCARCRRCSQRSSRERGIRPDCHRASIRPRKGIAPDVIDADGCPWQPQRVVYVSCDPGNARHAT